MRCVVCNGKVSVCDGCGEPFEVGEKIFCNIKKHFCSVECLFETIRIFVEKSLVVKETSEPPNSELRRYF